VDRYLKDLIASRQHLGDGTVVSIGDSTSRADVYWSNDGQCWVIVDRSDPARPKAHRADEIALVRLDPDVAGAPDMDEFALACDVEGDSLWLVDGEHIAELSVYGDAVTVLWRSEGKQTGAGTAAA